MKTLCFLILLYPAVLFAEPKPLLLALGETKLLSIRGTNNVWIQNSNVLYAEGRSSQLLIKGLKEGSTLLKVANQNYQVQVLHPAKLDSLQRLNEKLSKLVGLRVEVMEGDLLIVGRLFRFKDWQNLAEFAQSNSFNFQMQAELPRELQAEAQSYFHQRFSSAKVPPQTLIFSPNIEIRANCTEIAFKKYLKILAPFGVQIVRDEGSLDVAPTIKVQITVAEVKKDFNLKYGLKWPASYSATVMTDGQTSGEDLPFNATALEIQGFGKILASPNLVCRSGKEAEFLAGGEFPIKVMNFKMADVQWKRYGILLRVKPKADSAGRISLTIETEVTTIDDSRKVDDVPGVFTNRVSSHFDLTRPQTIALSGLLKNEDGKSTEGLPLLSRIPILGGLFASKDFRENRSELVIFVRPEILSEDEYQKPEAVHLRNKMADEE